MKHSQISQLAVAKAANGRESNGESKKRDYEDIDELFPMNSTSNDLICDINCENGSPHIIPKRTAVLSCGYDNNYRNNCTVEERDSLSPGEEGILKIAGYVKSMVDKLEQHW